MKKYFKFILLFFLICTSLCGFTVEAKIGDVVGKALHTDIVAYINHYAIPSYAVNRQSCIVAEDLRNFGFDVIWDGNARTLTIVRNGNTEIGKMMEFDKRYKPGSVFAAILETDIVVKSGEHIIPSYSMNGYTMVPMESLWMLGEVNWVAEQRAIKLWVDGLEIPQFTQPVPKYNTDILPYAKPLRFEEMLKKFGNPEEQGYHWSGGWGFSYENSLGCIFFFDDGSSTPRADSWCSCIITTLESISDTIPKNTYYTMEQLGSYIGETVFFNGINDSYGTYTYSYSVYLQGWEFSIESYEYNKIENAIIFISPGPVG